MNENGNNVAAWGLALFYVAATACIIAVHQHELQALWERIRQYIPQRTQLRGKLADDIAEALDNEPPSC